MPHLKELQELTALTKLFLLSEHSLKEWKFSDEETYRFFKERAGKLPPKEPPKELPKPSPKAETPKEALKVEAPKEVPKPAPKAEAPKEVPKIEPPAESPKAESDFSDIKKILESRFPALTLLMTPPDDSEARKVKETSVGAVVILSFERQTSPFLKNLSLAIQQELAPCTIISAPRLESENEWENLLRQEQLKLILSTDYGLFSLKNGMAYYREVPKQAKSFLGNIPLLLLTDLSLYLKEPKLKPTLWRAIGQMLQQK